ncbi:hypothetical protein IWW50_004776 [Coemansia erecta]|nr:hypothetical protein IWW50_004776 [Coemansia erecta]
MSVLLYIYVQAFLDGASPHHGAELTAEIVDARFDRRIGGGACTAAVSAYGVPASGADCIRRWPLAGMHCATGSGLCTLLVAAEPNRSARPSEPTPARVRFRLCTIARRLKSRSPASAVLFEDTARLRGSTHANINTK